jgi:hypothetical protein
VSEACWHDLQAHYAMMRIIASGDEMQQTEDEQEDGWAAVRENPWDLQENDETAYLTGTTGASLGPCPHAPPGPAAVVLCCSATQNAIIAAGVP